MQPSLIPKLSLYIYLSGQIKASILFTGSGDHAQYIDIARLERVYKGWRLNLD